MEIMKRKAGKLILLSKYKKPFYYLVNGFTLISFDEET